MKVKRKVRPPKTSKVCKICDKEKLLTSEFWRHNAAYKDGWSANCKPCDQQAIKDHYLHYGKDDLDERGSTGVRCPIWAPKCGVCTDWAACWRIAKVTPGSDSYPDPLILE